MISASQNLANYNYAIRDIVSAAEKLEAEGREITYLNIGDPQVFDFRPPEEVIVAVERAIRDQFTGYSHSAGLIQARRAVAEYATDLGVPTTPDDIIITNGASEAADLTLTALLDPGDEVLVPAPGYPLYPAIINRLGATPVFYELDPSNGWSINFEKLSVQVTQQTKAIVLINPNNPTGSILSDDVVMEILEWAHALGLLVISDEVYRDLCFEMKPTSASVLALQPKTPVITLESLSKTHIVPGWRVGWLRYTNSLEMQPLTKAIYQLACGRLCSSTPAQYAVEPALSLGDDFRWQLLHQLKRRRDVAVAGLNGIAGFSCDTPAAAFYLMVKSTLPDGGSDQRFAMRVLEETGTLVVPGSGLGLSKASGYFRMVFLAPEEKLQTSIDRMSEMATRLRIANTSHPSISA